MTIARNVVYNSMPVDHNRSHNDANEITGITGGSWIVPVYNAVGNMIEGPHPGDETTRHKYIYDAWNRLVEVTDNSDVTISTYEYDGFNRRIVKVDKTDVSDVEYDYYFNESWQIVEVRKDGDTDPLLQFVWHGFYIDAPAYRYYDENTDGNEQQQYFTFDANFNVTALISSGASVLERYEYDPYGNVTVLNPNFSDHASASGAYEQHILFAGYRHDVESGLYEVRNRALHPTLGRWMQRDPIGYIDGGSLYEYVRSNPVVFTDPTGAAIAIPFLVPVIIHGARQVAPHVIRGLLVFMGAVAILALRDVCWGCYDPIGPGAAGLAGQRTPGAVRDLSGPASTPIAPRIDAIPTPIADRLPIPRADPLPLPIPKEHQKCEFYRLWCEWGDQLPPSDPGKPYWENTIECELCYLECKVMGDWPFELCPMGGSRGPRHPDDDPWLPWPPVLPD